METLIMGTLTELVAKVARALNVPQDQAQRVVLSTLQRKDALLCDGKMEELFPRGRVTREPSREASSPPTLGYPGATPSQSTAIAA
jgi:hypothetical protein